MPHNLLIRDVRPTGGPATDVLVRAGRIVQLGAGLEAPGTRVLDGGGRLMLPGLVEAHTHLDKSLIGMGWHPHLAGPRIIDKIESERKLKRARGIDPERQARRQVLQSVAFGTTHIRSHVDVDTEHGLAGIEGVAAARAGLRDVCSIELVAFPQSGLLNRPGTLELMDQALSQGADVVGGLDPCSMDRDPKGHLDAVFDLSQKHGKPIDIHLHEPGEMGAFSIELILERTKALGLSGRVVISHAYCLGAADRELTDPLIAAIAGHGVAVMTTAPMEGAPLPLLRLLDAGVVVCSGSDGIRDSWSPYGNGDMLERAMLIGMRNDLARDDEIERVLAVCTTGGARAMRLSGYGLEPGCAADCVLLPGETIADAVVTRPAMRTVIKSGRVVT